MIQIEANALDAETQQSFQQFLSGCDIILMTSRYSVRHFFQLVNELGLDLTAVLEKDFAVIGKTTGDVLREYVSKPFLIAQEETGKGMFQALQEKYELSGKKVLFPRSSLSNPYLFEQLKTVGADVLEVPIYRNVKPEKRALPEEKVDTVFFTSPSTVKNFLTDYEKIPDGWRILSKGPRTTECLQEHGYSDIEEVS